jgi:hypothetical protein
MDLKKKAPRLRFAKLTFEIEKNGAGDGDRTRDIQLGKLAFYR